MDFFGSPADLEAKIARASQSGLQGFVGGGWGDGLRYTADGSPQFVAGQNEKYYLQILKLKDDDTVPDTLKDSNGFYYARVLTPINGKWTVADICTPYDATQKMTCRVLHCGDLEDKEFLLAQQIGVTGTDGNTEDAGQPLFVGIVETVCRNRWAKIYGCVTKATEEANCYTAEAHLCNCDGGEVEDDIVNIYWENTPWRFPNAINDNIVQVFWNSKYQAWMCPTQDDFVGAIKMIDCEIDIPQGWGLYAAALNRFVMGYDSGSGSCGSVGGSVSAVVYPNGDYYATAASCIDVVTNSTLGVLTKASVPTCASRFNLPPYTVSTLPPFIRLRHIIREDNTCEV